MQYNQLQNDYCKRYKSKLSRQFRITGYEATDNEIEDILENENEPRAIFSGVRDVFAPSAGAVPV